MNLGETGTSLLYFHQTTLITEMGLCWRPLVCIVLVTTLWK